MGGSTSGGQPAPCPSPLRVSIGTTPADRKDYQFDKSFRIGRTEACEVCIQDDHVSRTHAEIVLFDDGRLFIRDSGSQNGTFLERDGRRNPLQASFVEDDDVIVFGEVDLRGSTLREMVAASKNAPPRTPFTP